MTAEAPMLELADLIADCGGGDLLRCMQCGSCTGACPWPTVKRFSPRQVIRLASLGLAGYEAEDIWTCVTCGSCLGTCPRGVDVIEVMRATRVLLINAGQAPKSFAVPLGSLRAEGNPWSGSRAERSGWAEDLALPPISRASEHLLLLCCTQSYDPRGRLTARALVALLRAAAVRFGVLGNGQSCCGEQARSLGAEELYQALRGANAELLRVHEVRSVIVSSPHCLQGMKRDAAAELGLEVVHSAELLDTLIAERRLVPRHPVAMTVTYHDPCYLGRHGGQYEAPRRVLRAIPGLTLVEMARSRATSLCCGGGGGGSWLEVPPAERFAFERVREAQATGATAIVTACPYCIAMFEDAVKVLGLEQSLEVLEVAEILARSVDLGSAGAPAH